MRVRDDAARLPEEAGDEQREEGQVEEDEHRPEVDLPESLVQLVAGHLGHPVVDAAEEGEDEAAHDRVVEVRHREEAAVRRHVARRVREEHAGESADQEVEEPREGEQHRHRVADPASPERHHPAEEREAGRDRDQLRREHVERAHVGVDAADEQVVLPHEEGEQRDAQHARRPRADSPRAACAQRPAAARARSRILAARGCTPPGARRTRTGSRTGTSCRRWASTKKFVCAVRSSSAIRSVAISTGAASTISAEVEMTPQTKIGRRVHVRPGARMVTTVAIMFSPSSAHRDADEREEEDVAVHPGVRLDVQRRVARPAGREAAEEDRRLEDHAGRHQQPERQRLDPRERHPPGADQERDEVVAERAEDPARHHPHHHRAVDADERQVRAGRARPDDRAAAARCGSASR